MGVCLLLKTCLRIVQTPPTPARPIKPPFAYRRICELASGKVAARIARIVVRGEEREVRYGRKIVLWLIPPGPIAALRTPARQLRLLLGRRMLNTAKLVMTLGTAEVEITSKAVPPVPASRFRNAPSRRQTQHRRAHQQYDQFPPHSQQTPCVRRRRRSRGKVKEFSRQVAGSSRMRNDPDQVRDEFCLGEKR